AYKSSNVNTQNRETDLTELNEIVPINILEKNAIINAIKFTKGNKRKAANLLGLSERTLYRKLNEYGI
ncbi:MAG: sigma-54-dependent Fis family transcriptional regulator, partial [Ignavibacteriae bacterium]|nr:sigma-54-dependent Fis family transcriptional regulator [Ignavibacteriota bacterium]